MESKQITIARRLKGYRLDIALVNSGLELSRRKIREIIDAGGVYVNQKRVRISSRTVNEGDKLTVQYSLDTLKKLKAQSFILSKGDIVFEDDFFIALNKPPGLPSQATKDQSIEHVTVCLAKYFAEQGQNIRKESLVLVHRLDKETSGLIIVAKNNKVATYFTDLFRDGGIRKEYHALSLGVAKQKEFVEKCYLSAIGPTTGVVKVVHSGGKSSETLFKVLHVHEKEQISKIACFPKTGRSHQIRVHLLNHKLPLVGDKKYGKGIPHNPDLAVLAAEHHMLHACKLSFKHPGTHDVMQLEASYPQRFRELCERLGF